MKYTELGNCFNCVLFILKQKLKSPFTAFYTSNRNLFTKAYFYVFLFAHKFDKNLLDFRDSNQIKFSLYST